MNLSQRQQEFFLHLAAMQDTAVQSCMARQKCDNPQMEGMLYEATYDMACAIMELLDGYSCFSSHRHDSIDTVTGERLNAHPQTELHDAIAAFLRVE